MYPNPASDQVFFEGLDQAVPLTLFNAWGQQLELPPILQNTEGTSLDVAGVPAGVYTVVVGGGQALRLVVER
jgi:hypothetical protein